MREGVRWVFILHRTKETLAAGNYLSVINILMQLRKVGSHYSCSTLALIARGCLQYV